MFIVYSSLKVLNFMESTFNRKIKISIYLAHRWYFSLDYFFLVRSGIEIKTLLSLVILTQNSLDKVINNNSWSLCLLLLIYFFIFCHGLYVFGLFYMPRNKNIYICLIFLFVYKIAVFFSSFNRLKIVFCLLIQTTK